ncbi:hypothetical protein F1D05_18595 [Kribbella qitaiheensis]|uniref:DUF222 domain-containing protein n=1 Tax=Kribbella qitaiheensis TaxID=1544730 RepID=A0A7G6WZZ5_9ACTN|nr:hypothetical protein [Kribbella qitaiheensis]QNE19560.1 hypothetical protein F1D05_18595 [Kribbella qitaiheensis]
MFATDFTDCDAAQTLAAASAAYEQQRQSELDLILTAQHHADLHPRPGRSHGRPGGEQARVYGGDGNPEIAEFAVAEFGVMIGRSPGSAARFVGQCVALRHRFPLTWQRVKSGHATGWRALQVVQECVELSAEAAAIVDRRVADLVDTVTLAQLQKIIKAASWRADPEAADAKAKASAKERGVWVGRTDEHGSTKLYLKGATGDVIQLYATITQLAAALAALGDTGTIDQRRAKAAGLLSDPALAADLLAAAQHLATTQPTTEPTGRPAAEPAMQADDPETEAHGDTDQQVAVAEPGPDDEADRDHPHPDTPGHPLDHAIQLPVEPSTTTPLDDAARGRPGDDSVDPTRPDRPDRSPGQRPPLLSGSPGTGQPPEPVPDRARAGMDAAARLELRRKVDATRQDRPEPGRRTYQTVVNLHITDETLLAGKGVARVEGYGAVYTDQVAELLGHHRIVIRPVIDLNTALSVHAYEIPNRISDHVNQRYPIEQFPYGTTETRTTPNHTGTGGGSASTDLDHIQPYKTGGPPNQTSTDNLAPQGRFGHRLKTHDDWKLRRIDNYTLEWTTKHGYTFHIDHTGTHPIPKDQDQDRDRDRDRDLDPERRRRPGRAGSPEDPDAQPAHVLRLRSATDLVLSTRGAQAQHD